jgi:hypothetical protein
MNRAKLGTTILTTLAFFAKLTTFTVYAASGPFPEVDPGIFGTIVGKIYNLLYPIAIIYGILQIIVAGYKIMRSEGEPKTLSEAKEHLTDSIVGIVFIILAVVILKIIIKSFLYQDVAI